MAKLNIKHLYPNSLHWELNELDISYNRDDRLIQVQIIKVDENTKEETVVVDSCPIGANKYAYQYKNKMFQIAGEIQKAAQIWKFNSNIKSGESYYIRILIHYSVQKIETSYWQLEAQKIPLKEIFPCYPYFNCGNYSTDGTEVLNAFKLLVSEDKINELYKEANKLYNNKEDRKKYITEQMIYTYCYNSKTKQIKNSILEWYPFPSGEDIVAQHGKFSWSQWLINKKYCTTDKNNNIVVVPLTKILETPAPITVSKDYKDEDTSSGADWGYSDGWLDTNNNVTILSTAGTSYKALFPPILEAYQPAFIGKKNSSYEIFFRLSNYTNLEDVAHVDLKVNLQANGENVVNINNWPEEIIYKIRVKKNGSSDIKNHGNGLYSVNLFANASNSNESSKADLAVGHWQNNTYYKVQMRIGTEWTGWDNNEEYFEWRDQQASTGKFSEWSTPMILKSISAPKLYFVNNQTLEELGSNYMVTEFSTQPIFTAVYEQPNSNYLEPLEQYQFNLYDDENKLIESSDWIYYTEYSDKKISFSHYFNETLQQSKKYKVEVKIITKNLYETSSIYNFKVLNPLDVGDITFPDNTDLFTEIDEENGIINVYLESTSFEQKPVKALVLTRIQDGSSKEQEMLRISCETFDISAKRKIYTDFTVENEIGYIYKLYLENQLGQRGNPLSSEKTKVAFEHYYLYDQGKQLKIKYNPDIKSFKRTTLAQKQDTLGGKYPIILRNGMAHYAEFPIGGLISVQSEYDGISYFIDRSENLNDIPNEYNRITLKNGQKIGPYIASKDGALKDESRKHNLSSDNFLTEKQYRDKVEEFLNNGNYKLFRSPSEGNFIIGLTNISFTPNQQLGRMISSFTAQAYEVMECSIDNLKNYCIIENEIIEESVQEIKYIGQIAGLYDQNTNLLTVISESLAENEELKTLNDIVIEPYPNLEFEKQKAYYVSENEQLNFEETIQLQQYFYNTNFSTAPIHLTIGQGNTKSYDGLVATNKKYYLNDLGLTLKDYIKIQNNIPVIITYTATKIKKDKENVFRIKTAIVQIAVF